MDAEVRQLVNAALRQYDQNRNAAFRRFSGVVSRALAMDDAEGRRLMDDAWRVYVDEMQEAQAAMPNVPIVSNQILYNLRRRSAERDVIPYCRRNDITVIAYSPLHEGALVGNRGGRLRRALGRNRDNDVLEEVAGKVGKTAAQVALNWVADQEGIIAIPKSNSVDRTEANCAASGWSLTADQRRALERVFPI